MSSQSAPIPGHRPENPFPGPAGLSEMNPGSVRNPLAEVRALLWLGLLCLPMIWSGLGTSNAVASTDDTADERAGSHSVPYFPSASDAVREGFVRVINHSDHSGEVEIAAVDDAGHAGSHVTLSIAADATVHFNSEDLENGNTGKGLTGSAGSTDHDWRLMLSSELDIEVLAYIRTPADGFLTSMHDVVPADSMEPHSEESDHDHDHGDDHHGDDEHGTDYKYTYQVAIFNPGRNMNQRSRLRITNPGDDDVEVRITATDDHGTSTGDHGDSDDDHGHSHDGHGHSDDDHGHDDDTAGYVSLSIPAGTSRTLAAADLESGHEDFEGALGAGEGKWQLWVKSEQPVTVMSLLLSPEGYLSNLSTAPKNLLEYAHDDHGHGGDSHGHGHEEGSMHFVPMFPAAGDTSGRQGFVRVINRSDDDGEVTIHAYDDAGAKQGPLTLTIGAGRTAHFNSDDLESGAMAKGLSGMVVPGMGDWWLTLESELDIQVLAYIRIQGDDPATSGFLSAMHDIAQMSAGRHRVAILNPGANPNQQSRLRIVNPGDETAEVEIAGVDDEGHESHDPIELTVAPGAARTFTAMVLEEGDAGFEGELGDGAGKWQLNVTSEQPIIVMSLMSVPTGHLTNLSTAPSQRHRESAAEVFHESISAPIVQARCINCHVDGGQSSHTRLVFVSDSEHDHETTNFNVFRDFLASDDHDGHDHDGQSHRELILYKIQGMNSHGGGVQVTADSPEFRNMDRFLTLLEAEIRAADDDDGHDHDHHH